MVLLSEIAEEGFFEGTEKLLEIWFSGNNAEDEQDLRTIPRYELDNLLKIVNAVIVSYTHNEHIDSYVLSESSMFISKNRFIIKTCGITKLLYAVKPMIELASRYGNMNVIQDFFYSRRVYLRPEEQHSIHKTFQDEVNFLTEIVPEGKPYVLGQEETEQWNLFMMTNAGSAAPSNDVTLEILMSDLCEETMAHFTKRKYDTSDQLVQETGISWIIPGSVNDGLVFEPIGYSLNGLFGDSYYTIHVTPQPMCSYVSFETNLPQNDYTGLVERVLKTFKPGKFIATLFCSKDAACGQAENALRQIALTDYICSDEHSHHVGNYSIAYRSYMQE